MSGEAELIDEAVRSLRAVILAGESYRAGDRPAHWAAGTTETQAISYLAVHGSRGQNELMADLRITSGAATALVDRLESKGLPNAIPTRTIAGGLSFG